MGFQGYHYTRPNMKKFGDEFKKLLQNFYVASTVYEQELAMNEINDLRNEFSTMENICSIRHSVDTNDKFYEDEQAFFDENTPIVQSYSQQYYKALIGSPFREQLEEKYGKQLFALAECEVKILSEEVIPDLQEENKLTTEYAKLVAAAKLPFYGEVKTLAQISAYFEDKDREVRKTACDTYFGYFAENQDKFDEIFDKLVKLRSGIAKKLGFKNFVDLAYARMLRTDYDAKDVKKFRDQVYETIVPIATELRGRQAKRIGVDQLYYYDDKFEFLTGNATPKGSPEWIIENGKKMYDELSKQTSEFFQFMLDENLLDLVAKEGKQGGGYCTYIPNYKAPYIFSNFNGTSGDIDVLTHEAGHAFQVYESRKFNTPEYYWPTYEACEIHSMSMEFFTWPWQENFFKEDTQKYYFTHLSSAVTFISYGVAVDEFQHAIYEQPELTPEERHSLWKKLEEKYLPHRVNDGNSYLEKGGLWQRQGHIYQSPFYYIDYTLAQICALQFWNKMHEDREAAWSDYVGLCQLGGSKSFLGLVSEANLESPFSEGSIDRTLEPVKKWLDGVNDRDL